MKPVLSDRLEGSKAREVLIDETSENAGDCSDGPHEQNL